MTPQIYIITVDVLIHGESDQKQDRHLIQVLNKCHVIGLKLNPEKCVFGAESVQLYGNSFGHVKVCSQI